MRWNFTLPFAMASLLCLLANPVCAQINVFTTNDGGFENSTSSFSANGWTEVNDNNSKWYVGTAAVGGGSKGAYIDKNASAGSVNTYNNNNALTSHFYRDFSIPTGATNITLTFKWRCGGESADNLRVYVVPTTTTPAAGTALSTGLVGGSYFGQGTSFQSPSITLTGIAGTTRRLVFSWTQNANNSGANPPAAVDDVQIQYTLPGCTGTPNQGSITAGATSFCGSGATTLTLTGATTGSGISYQWQYYNGTTWVATGTNATTHNTGTLSATTQFRVVTTCSNSGLAATSPTATITVNPSPDVSVSPADTFICTSGGSMTLTATGTATSYTWSPGTDLNTTTGSTVIATPANGRSYTVTGTLGPCSTSAIAIVSVGSGPAITSSANPAVLCSGESTQLTSSQASGEYEVYPIAPYVLTPESPTVALQYPGFAPTNNNYDDGRTAPISLPFNFTFYGNSYSQMFFATNGVIGFTQNNLVDYVPQNLPDGGNPNNLIALFWHDMDMSSTGTVSYGTVGTAPNRRFVVTYSGVPTLGNSSPDNSGQVILHETTNYIDVVVEKSTTGDYKTLGIENQGGSAGLTPSNRNDDYWTVTSTPEAYRFAIPSYTHSWSPGTFLGATNIYNPAASNVTATTAYTVNIKNSVTGCASNSTVTVTANPLPTASVTAGTSPVCDGQSSSVTFTGTPNATVTYDVNGGTAQTVTLDGSGSATVSTGSISSTAVYQLQSVTSAQNCTEMITGSATIVVNVRPTASITGSQAICDGATAFPTISIGQGTPPWTVTYTDGTTTFTETSSFTSFALTLAPSVTTTYTLVDITDANCASVAGDVSGSAVITVHPRPTATLATTVPYVCEGSSAGLVVTLTGTPPYQFDVFDGSSYTSYTNITTATYTIPVNPLSATTYSISYLQDANCIGSGADLGNTVMLGYYTRPTATIQGSGTICSGNSTNITVTLTGSGPWSITYHDGSSNVPVTGIGTSPHVFSVSPSVSSTYTLVSVSDANCQAIPGDMSGSAVVAVNNGPVILSQSGDVSGCSGSNAVLAVNATGTGLTYQWMENGAPLSDGGVYTGATTATLQISDITSLGGNSYQLQITGTCPPVISSTPVAITENTVNNWIGVVDTKWSTPGNWSCGILPTAATNVNITPSAPFQPEVDIPTAICRRLLIYPGSSVEIIGSGNALEVKTDVINLGQFDADAGKLILSGNGPQNAPGVVYKELEVLGGSVKTFLGNVMVTGNLNLYAGYIQLGQYNLTIAENANV
ncbi:MAG: hypothetical protein JNL72_08640, partial [Flavipsychrobacter sp.]|nr:hypothetical protein [Flavipsychrobacter sp.]